MIRHSLGADAVMEMADYLGDKAVPVALVVPFDGTQSFPVPGNVGRVINFTQRDYAYMRPGPGFRGSLSNVDLSADPTIGHTTIDKSPRLHVRVIAEVLAIVGGRGVAAPAAAKPAPIGEPAVRANDTPKPVPNGSTLIIALPEERGASTRPATPPAPPPPQKPFAAPQQVDPAQIPD